jgi:hypothetical protein
MQRLAQTSFDANLFSGRPVVMINTGAEQAQAPESPFAGNDMPCSLVHLAGAFPLMCRACAFAAGDLAF